MQNQNKNSQTKINMNQPQQQIVLFKFKRAFRQESFDEIKIHSKKIKANPQNVQKASQQYRKRNFLDRETMLTEMFQKLQLKNNQTEEKINQKDNQQERKKSSYFLKRVDIKQLTQAPQQQQPQIKNDQVRTQATRIRLQARRQSLQQKLNKNRGIFPQLSSANQEQKKRIKYKIIDIRQQNLVELNGEKIQYEDLSKEYSKQEKLRMGTVYDYYVLRKGKITKANNDGYQPEIILPEEAQYLLQEQENAINEQSPQQSQQDSNREDRSDYDYPQQDYHEGDSDNESQGIISGGNKQSGSDEYGDGQDDDLKNDYKDEDQEEYYRQYLKRCRRKQKGDEEITYLYNMKPAKYQDESDQY